MKYTLTEQNLNLTIGEKIADRLSSSKIVLFAMIPIIIILIPAIIIFLLVALAYEGLIEKTYYKLTGKKQKTNNPINQFANLPIQIDVQSIFLIDGLIEKMKADYNWSDLHFRDLELVKIITVPEIIGLADTYFDPEIIVFNGDIFVQKANLPDLKYTLCYIDCKKLTFTEFKDVELYGNLKFDKTENKITILIRGYLKRKLLTLKSNS